MSTKCQYRPDFRSACGSRRCIFLSTIVTQISRRIPTPMITCRACMPVIAKYSEKNISREALVHRYGRSGWPGMLPAPEMEGGAGHMVLIELVVYHSTAFTPKKAQTQHEGGQQITCECGVCPVAPRYRHHHRQAASDQDCRVDGPEADVETLTGQGKVMKVLADDR